MPARQFVIHAMITWLCHICFFATFLGAVTSQTPVKLDVDWESFLSRADLVWSWSSQVNKPSSTTPTKWYHSAFVGNGALGMMIRCNPSDPTKSLYFSVSNSAVWDDRQPGANYTTKNFVLDRPRLPSGHFLLNFSGQIQNASMRLHLWDAEVTGTVITTQGVGMFRVFANSRYDVADTMLIELNTTGGELGKTAWQWIPEPADSTWAGRDKSYVFNPPPVQSVMKNINVTTQRHLSGKSHALAFQTVDLGSQGGISRSVMHISISPVVDDGTTVAVNNVLMSVKTGLNNLISIHHAWWHQYYPASFLTFNDTRIESFYWIQMYKLASGTRSDRIVYDLMGPWFIDGTPWPDLHWDLNVQLTYYPLYTANRLSLAESLYKLLDNNVEHLTNNVPEQYRYNSAAAPSGASSLECMETCYWNYGPGCLTSPPTVIGNLLWTCQLYWLHYRYSLNTTLLSNGLYPLLSKAVNYYTHLQITNSSDHVIHLPVTFSPEYPGPKGPDTNYDLALYRWGLETVVHIARDVLHTKDPSLSLWEDSLARLTDYPIDKNGYMIARGVPFNISHRHFSHLFMIWPLNLINWSNQSAVAIAEKSVDHWIGMGTSLTGFCRPAVSVMSSLMGRRRSAFTNITYLLDKYILPNTFYHEGENGECGETPPMAASAIQDMMLMSDRGEIWVFPGLDDNSLIDVAFHQLRAEGAFLVSSKRVAGRTDWVLIQSERGAPCILRSDMQPPLRAEPNTVQLHQFSNGSVAVDLSGGQSVVIYSVAQGIPQPDFTIQPSPGNKAYYNFWGLHQSGG